MTRSTPPNAAVVLAMTPTGLAVARSLHRRGVPVYGVDAKAWEIGHRSSLVTRPPFALEPPGPRLVDALVEWGARQDAPPVLIPADDPYSDFLSEHHEALGRSCLVHEGYRPRVAAAFVDKIAFYRHCMKLGFDLPRTFFPEAAADLEPIVRELRFPAILKPAHGHLWRRRFHGKKVLEVGSGDELRRTFDALGDLGTGMTVQEVIPGPEREIFVCGGYFRSGGRPQAVFTARKTRQYPPGFGSGSLVSSEWQPDVARKSIDLIAALGYAGICGTEFKPDPRDGRWKLIEVNPRPTLWFSICRAAGCDVVWHAYLDRVGRTPPPQIGDQVDGVRWQYALRDLLSLVHYGLRGDLGLGALAEALSPLRKDEAIASVRDPSATLYYPLYGFKQWRMHARGEDSGP